MQEKILLVEADSSTLESNVSLLSEKGYLVKKRLRKKRRSP